MVNEIEREEEEDLVVEMPEDYREPGDIKEWQKTIKEGLISEKGMTEEEAQKEIDTNYSEETLEEEMRAKDGEEEEEDVV